MLGHPARALPSPRENTNVWSAPRRIVPNRTLNFSDVKVSFSCVEAGNADALERLGRMDD
jgi:hypothetical protein